MPLPSNKDRVERRLAQQKEHNAERCRQSRALSAEEKAARGTWRLGRSKNGRWVWVKR